MFFTRAKTETIPLYVTIKDKSFTIAEKGKILLEQKFSNDETCFTAISSFLKKRKHPHAHFLLAGSRLVSQTRIVRYAHPDLFAADESMRDRLIENTTQTFLDEYKAKNLKLIMKQPLSMTLNGYKVSELKHQKVSDMQITVACAAINADYHKKISSPIESLPFREVAELYKKEKVEEFMVASVHERTTDLSIRKQGGFFETVTVPIGTEHVVEHLKNGLAISETYALLNLSLYHEDKLDLSMQTKFEDALSSFHISLDNEMKKALTTLSEGISLPSMIYLNVPATFIKAFARAFRGDSYHSLCFSEKGFEVKNIEGIIIS